MEKIFNDWFGIWIIFMAGWWGSYLFNEYLLPALGVN